MKDLARRAPVTLILVALMWLLFAATRGRAPEVLGFTLPADTELWHVATSGVTSAHVVGLVFATLAALLFATTAEVKLGSRTFVVAAVCSQAVAVPLGLMAATLVEEAGFNQWGADLTNETFQSPVAWIFGPLAFATAGMGVLWRRRLRLVMLALTGTMVVYAGTLADVIACAAVVIGLAAGALVHRDGQPVPARFTVSLREARVLVAGLVAVVAAGPVVTALSPVAVGPFAATSQLMWEPTVASHQVARLCRNAASPQCLDALAINQQNGLGPFLLNLVPLILALITAAGLVRGRRLARVIALAMTVSSLVIIVAQIADPAGDALHAANVALVVLPWVVVAAVLVASRRLFAVESDWLPALGKAVAAFVITAVVWIGGAFAMPGGFLTTPTFQSVLAELPHRYLPPVVALLLPHHLVPRTSASWLLYEWIGIVFWAVALYAVHRALTSPPSPAAETERARARGILTSGTGDHLSWMGLWDGNRYFFHGDDGYVAYRVSRGVAVTVGGPVWTEATCQTEVAEAFESFAASQGWRVAWYSVSADFARPGFRLIHVAEESLLYTDNLEFAGKKFQNIRTARNRAGKEGVRAVWTSWAECDMSTRKEIVALSEQWVAEKSLPEMGFTLGGIDELRDADTMLMLALDDEGRLHGVTSWLPVYEAGQIAGYTLDFMRRDAEGFRPTVEFLLAETAVKAGELGLGWVSLSGAPLARTDQPESLPEVILDRAGASIEPLYGFRSLAASKHKFHPTHSGWYLAYDDELALGAIAWAVVSCYLPTMKPADYAGVVREFLSNRQPADRGAGSSPADAPSSRL
ncbi:bifunctional lysylphosphatidylglycerol flippase/synthetase MprF [Corynebacterium sp. LK2510]|uniref:bifunctional lysylphosphatidylglycerol flippase/synthetase MprF n=1 Tax=Corynebacterium sp. LK2510 TaxID=3110472 RepID=UPI0034CFE8E3